MQAKINQLFNFQISQFTATASLYLTHYNLYVCAHCTVNNCAVINVEELNNEL